MNKVITLTMLIFGLGISLYAQNNLPTPREEAIERVRAGLTNPFEGSRLQALAFLAQATNAGTISAQDSVELLQLVLILDSTDTDYTSPSLVSFPSVRIQALNVIRDTHNKTAGNLVVWVLANDQDDVVVEQALITARAIQIDTSTELILALARILKDPYPNFPHDSLMLEALNTISWIHNNKGGISVRPIFEALVNISEHPRYLQIVRRTAASVIRQLVGTR